MVELILENEQDKEELTPEIEKAIKDVCVAVMEEEECAFAQDGQFANPRYQLLPRKHRKGFMEIVIHQGAAESLPRKCH